jgi:hypothetical protein
MDSMQSPLRTFPISNASLASWGKALGFLLHPQRTSVHPNQANSSTLTYGDQPLSLPLAVHAISEPVMTTTLERYTSLSSSRNQTLSPLSSHTLRWSNVNSEPRSKPFAATTGGNSRLRNGTTTYANSESSTFEFLLTLMRRTEEWNESTLPFSIWSALISLTPVSHSPFGLKAHHMPPIHATVLPVVSNPPFQMTSGLANQSDMTTFMLSALPHISVTTGRSPSCPHATARVSYLATKRGRTTIAFGMVTRSSLPAVPSFP